MLVSGLFMFSVSGLLVVKLGRKVFSVVDVM